MSGEKKLEEIIILAGKLTAEELEAKRKAIESGEEPLPDGTRYPDRANDVHVKIFWEVSLLKTREFIREKQTVHPLEPRMDPDLPDFAKCSKQFLDIKLRPVSHEDLILPLKPGTNRHDVEVAIQGGRNSISLNFLESEILFAIQKAHYEQIEKVGLDPIRAEIRLTRAQLYHLLKFQERGAEDRRKIDRAIQNLGKKAFPFIFKQFTHRDKKGEPRFMVVLAHDSIVFVAAVYEDVKQPELPGIEAQKPGAGKKRFSYYRIKLNPCAFGELRYFRLLPSGFFRELSEFRTSRGEKVEVYEANFIEYLFTESRETIDINFLKLAEKVKIKGSGRPDRIRKALNRCYESAQALGFVSKVETDRPGILGTKEIIYLNPARFKYLKGRLLDKACLK